VIIYINIPRIPQSLFMFLNLSVVFIPLQSTIYNYYHTEGLHGNEIIVQSFMQPHKQGESSAQPS
jgi:hypothetical protein